MPEAGRRAVEEALNELQHRIKDADIEDVRAARERLDGLVERELEPYEKSAWREYVESIGIAVVLALFLRGFAFEAFKIPSGSMIPTLLIGDHLFVNKLIYGIRIPFTQNYVVSFAEAQPGEVVVFSFPHELARAHLAVQPASQRGCIDRASLYEEKDMIKRIIGVAGDTVEVKGDTVLVNGAALKTTFLHKKPTNNYMHPYYTVSREERAGKEYTVRHLKKGGDFGPVKVKAGHIFVMGDNRDESSDSRCWGQVPVEHIKGRAIVLWWSRGEDGVRWERFGDAIK